MKVKLLFKISNGRKNSRWLVEYNKTIRKSVLIPNERQLNVGDETEVTETELCSNTYESKYNKYLSSVENIKTHLTKYGKTRSLLLNGKWNNIQYSHILQNEKDNLLYSYGYDEILDRVYEEQKKKGNIHEGFSNLNSSQAFAFNFFSPMIEEAKNGINLFKNLLHDENLELPIIWEFEKVLPEDNTQLDFYLASGKKRYTFEVKYTENAFGDAEKNERHQIKYNNHYREKLDSIISVYNANEFENQFFEEYQLWRNLCGLCIENTTVCFVFHKYRTDLEEKIENAKKMLKNDDLKKRVKILKVDKFVEEILKSGSEKQKRFYSEFKEKYLELDK